MGVEAEAPSEALDLTQHFPQSRGSDPEQIAPKSPARLATQTYDLDCLLVHAPKADNHYLPIGDFFNITYLPMGMLALAELLRRRGHRTELMHLGVEWLVNPQANVLESLQGQRIRTIGFSLYWHYQSYDAIEAARHFSESHPEAFIFLGGVTASYFAEEILRTFPFIHAVVKGHAEVSLLQLVEAIQAGEHPTQANGIVWRDPATGDIHETSHSPDSMQYSRGTSSVPILDELVYGDLSVLRHAEVYAQRFGFPLAYSREFSADENLAMLTMGRTFFPLFTGRGCPYSCTFCGGNRDTLRGINGTSRIQWRSPKRVVEDIRRAMAFGYRTMSLCFDPTPQQDDYYITLFELIEREKLGCDFYFECWGLPTPRFVKTFRRVFPSPESYLAVSPDAGNERVRKANKQPHYTDEALFESLELLKRHEITVDVFFTLALPGETLKEAMDTALLKRKIAQSYANTRRVMTWTVQLEPGSPQFEHPERYDMLTDRHGFLDFYKAHGGDRADTYSSLGFKIHHYFGDERDNGTIADFERELQHLKCMEFCFLAKDPRQWNMPEAGRQQCLERRQLLAQRRGHGLPKLKLGPGVYYEDAMAEEAALRGKRARYEWLVPTAMPPASAQSIAVV